MKQNLKQIKMKKYFITLSVLILLAACGTNDTKQSSGTENKDSASVTEKPASSDDVTANPDYQKGLALVAKSDCLTCHKVSEKVQGPAYKDVAAKYAGNDTAINYLSNKIISGGSGVWGTIPMISHPTLSKADAEQMVKYILLLKGS